MQWVKCRFPGNPDIWIHTSCWTGPRNINLTKKHELFDVLIALTSVTMSVVVHNSRGWVLDACSLIDQSYSPCIRWTDKQKTYLKCCFKRQCFQTIKSHYSVKATSAADAGHADKPLKVNNSLNAAATSRTPSGSGECVEVLEMLHCCKQF